MLSSPLPAHSRSQTRQFPGHHPAGVVPTGAARPPAARGARPSPTPAPGPTWQLLALPQLPGGALTPRTHLERFLLELEQARRRQLDQLPTTPRTVVAAAHRRAVEDLLTQVRAARLRLRAGTYGRCTRCNAAIESDQLSVAPWQPTCGACARRTPPGPVRPGATGGLIA